MRLLDSLGDNLPVVLFMTSLYGMLVVFTLLKLIWFDVSEVKLAIAWLFFLKKSASVF